MQHGQWTHTNSFTWAKQLKNFWKSERDESLTWSMNTAERDLEGWVVNSDKSNNEQYTHLLMENRMLNIN
jgi:hypothetical protein